MANSTLLTIPYANKKHRVEIKKDSRGNYGTTANTWVKIYVKGERHPHTTSLFTDGTPIPHLVKWAKEAIEEYNNNHFKTL